MKSFALVAGLTLALLSTACTLPARHGALPSLELPAAWRAPSAAPAAEGTTDALSRALTSASDSGEASKAENAAADNRQWWQTFGDASLNALVEEALARNSDLAVAALLVRRAQIEARLAGERVSGGAGADTGVGTSAFDSNRFRLSAEVSARASYELDLWGKLAARRDEATWRALASDADRESAALTLVGTTAKLYWRIGYANETIALAQAAIADSERTLSIATTRFAAGAASALDVAQARQQYAQVRADQTRWRIEREANRNALALLVGAPPEDRREEPSRLSTVKTPSIPAGVPALVLARRPDLRAAEWRLRARLAHIDVTRASLYPSFALTGELGASSDRLVRVLQNPVASIGAALALPFLEWNTLRLNVALSEVDFDRASLEFRQALYRALADVEDALTATAQLDAAATLREEAANDAAIASALARSRFESGATDVAPLLDAQRTERAANLALAANRLARLENRMEVFLALGGG